MNRNSILIVLCLVRGIIAIGSSVTITHTPLHSSSYAEQRELSPLGTAASQGQIEQINALLHKGASINQWEFDGATPLTLAVQAGKKKAIILLLNAGANVNQYHQPMHAPILAATCQADAAIVQLLVREGARLPTGNISLHKSIHQTYKQAVLAEQQRIRALQQLLHYELGQPVVIAILITSFESAIVLQTRKRRRSIQENAEQ